MKEKTILEITPEDVIIVRSPSTLLDNRIDFIKNQIKEYFGTEKIIFLEEGINFEVVKPVSVFISKVKETLEKEEK